MITAHALTAIDSEFLVSESVGTPTFVSARTMARSLCWSDASTPVTLRIFPSGDLATPWAASATIVQLVTSRPSRETKKALPVRRSCPLASKTVISIIAGAAVCTTFRNSGGGVCAGGVAVTCATETEGLAATCGVADVADGAGVGVRGGTVSGELPCGGGFRPHHE